MFAFETSMKYLKLIKKPESFFIFKFLILFKKFIEIIKQVLKDVICL